MDLRKLPDLDLIRVPLIITSQPLVFRQTSKMVRQPLIMRLSHDRHSLHSIFGETIMRHWPLTTIIRR